MLVDASRFPAPAMWKGLMLILVAVWAIWLVSANRDSKIVRKSVVLLFVVGIILMPITSAIFSP